MYKPGANLSKHQPYVYKINIGFQPMNQIVEEDKFNNEVTKHLGIKDKLMFVARIGYIDRSQVPVSPRRPVEDFAQFVQ